MNKKFIYSLCAAALLMTGCDYNEDNFPGFDDAPITDVVYYEGEFTGKYPTEGYFSIVQGDEKAGKEIIEKALISMLKDTYPHCDKGSSAKVNVKVADVLPPQGSDPVASQEYTLAKEDYDAMGEESGKPGKYDNFDSKMDVNAYLTAFCATKYASEAEGTIVKVTYKYYASGSTADKYKFYKKTTTEWVEETGFVADKFYTFTNADYANIAGADDKGFAGSDTEVATLIAAFLKNKYIASNGMTVSLSYKHAGKSIDAIYRYNGQEWSAYIPSKEIVAGINDRITVMQFDGKEWKLSNLISYVVKVTLGKPEYTKLVEWVSVNKPEFMSTQNTTSEYYFGSDSKFGNLNNAYATWKQYYNVDGYLDDLKDDEVQALMDERLANDGLAAILLPDMITNPDPDTSYTVVYKIYKGRGDGNYAMSFYYNAEDEIYTWDEMTPVRQ